MLPLLNNDGSSSKQQNEKTRIETRALELVESDSFLRKVLRRCRGVDLPTALGLANGSKSACLAASEALGMNFNVLACVVSVARMNHRDVLKAINVLGADSTFGKDLSSDLLTLVFRLAERQNEESLRLAVKAILSYNVNLNKVSPHRLESIIAIGRGQINRIVDVVKEEASIHMDDDLTTFAGKTDGNTKKSRIKVMAAFLEIIRNDSSEFQELMFTSDWKELLGAVTELDTEVQDGIGYLRIGRVREPSAIKLLSDQHFDLTTKLVQSADDSNDLDSKTMSVNLASLLIGISRNNHDEVRLYGPGSESFSETVKKACGVVMIPGQLQGLIAIARGCLINVESLSQSVGLEARAGITIAHLIAEPNGFGNPFIGLQIKKGKKKAASAGHLTWISKCIGLDPAVYLGLTCISRNKVGDYRAALAVKACIKWFTNKLPTDLEESILVSHVETMIRFFSSTNSNSVRKACNLLFKDKMALNLMVSKGSSKIGLDPPENNQTTINDGKQTQTFQRSPSNKTTINDGKQTQTFQRSPSKQKMFVLGKSIATTIQSKIDYVEIVLFARGLIGDPLTWLQKAQANEFGPALKIKEINKLTAKIADIFDVDAHSINDPKLLDGWQYNHDKRIKVLTLFKKLLNKESKTRREGTKVKALKKMESGKMSFVGDLLMCEVNFPKKFTKFLTREGLSKEQVKKMSAFVQISCYSTLKIIAKQKMQSNLGSLMGLPTELLKNVLDIFHGKDAEVRLTSIIKIAKFAYDTDNDALPKKIKTFGQNVILYAECANKTHYSINKTANHLNQPRFLFHVISRDHETSFGASASGAADIPLQNSIVEFVKELKLAENGPKLLRLSTEARRQLLLEGISGVVMQDANKVQAFQNIIGLKKPETLGLACQLFGDVNIQQNVEHIEKLMSMFEKISKKELKFTSLENNAKLTIEKDSCIQPNPLSKSFYVWNFILMVIILFVCIKMPLEFANMWKWDMGSTYEVIIEILFLIDMLISFYTPYWDSGINEFRVGLICSLTLTQLLSKTY